MFDAQHPRLIHVSVVPLGLGYDHGGYSRITVTNNLGGGKGEGTGEGTGVGAVKTSYCQMHSETETRAKEINYWIDLAFYSRPIADRIPR